MSTIVANDKVVEKRKKSIRQQTYMLSNLRESGYKLRDKNTHAIVGPSKSAPKFLALANPSWHHLPEGGSTPIRYVKGAPTVFENDLWLEHTSKGDVYHISNDEDPNRESSDESKRWQLKKGLKTLKYDGKDGDFRDAYKRSLGLRIGFEEGFLNLHKFGGDPVLEMFVKYHHFNKNAPNWRMPVNTQFVFHCIDHEEVAEKQLVSMDQEAFAAVYIASLRTQSKNGFTYTQANKDKINATLHMLDLSGAVTEDDYAQKHVMVRDFAKMSTIAFVTFVQGSLDEKKMTVGIANSVGALSFDSESNEFKVISNEIPATLLSCEATTADGRMEELIVYLVNNPTVYRDLGFAVDAAKQPKKAPKEGKK